MRRFQTRVAFIAVLVMSLCALFQNCDAGFHYDPSSQQLSTLASSVDLSGAFALKAYSAGSASPLSDGTPISLNASYTLRAVGDTVSTGYLTWSLNSSSTATCSITSAGRATERNLLCSSTGTAIVTLKALWPDSTVSVVTLTKTVSSATATPTPTIPSADSVTFRIISGTSGSPWNTSANPVQVFVGQTLTVFNDDSTVHEIHTNGAPFPHESGSIAVNGSSSFVISSAHSGNATDVYDHLSTAGAIFYINSIDGAFTYAKNSGPGSCANCHGADVTSSGMRGASFTSIKNAIGANRGGMGAITLTDQELRAIAYVLNK